HLLLARPELAPRVVALAHERAVVAHAAHEAHAGRHVDVRGRRIEHERGARRAPASAPAHDRAAIGARAARVAGRDLGPRVRPGQRHPPRRADRAGARVAERARAVAPAEDRAADHGARVARADVEGLDGGGRRARAGRADLVRLARDAARAAAPAGISRVAARAALAVPAAAAAGAAVARASLARIAVVAPRALGVAARGLVEAGE